MPRRSQFREYGEDSLVISHKFPSIMIILFTKPVKIPCLYHKTHAVLQDLLHVSLKKVTELFALSGSALQGLRKRAFQVCKLGGIQ